ncbi:hypothetical protein [Paraburkholderia dipogonis]|uniref:hypothetical protein n=1 Tax=Paraburkholderia dipogonis TaxID=1211383 RepID=UPI0038B7695F
MISGITPQRLYRQSNIATQKSNFGRLASLLPSATRHNPVSTTTTTERSQRPSLRLGMIGGAWARRRRALEREREVGGRALFESLRKDLFDSPTALARIPPGGFLTISIVPALLSVASTSARCRQLCLDSIDSQLVLIDRSIEQALLRRRLDDRPVTQELRGFARAYHRAKALLATPLAAIGAESSVPSSLSNTEAYLSGTGH